MILVGKDGMHNNVLLRNERRLVSSHYIGLLIIGIDGYAGHARANSEVLNTSTVDEKYYVYSVTK